MADKKVGRSGRERPITPTQKMEAALSDPGTMSMADTTKDKGRSALVDKFREREERWRRDQALHDQQLAHPESAHNAERQKAAVNGSEEEEAEEDDGASGSGAVESLDMARGGGS